jgi:hypothetical protein
VVLFNRVETMSENSGEKPAKGYAPGQIEARLRYQWTKENPPPPGPGRPPGVVNWSTVMREMFKLSPEDFEKFLSKPLPTHIKRVPLQSAIMARVIIKALSGDLASVNFLTERMDGKLKDIIQVERDDAVNLNDLPPGLRAEVLKEMLEEAQVQANAEVQAEGQVPEAPGAIAPTDEKKD